MNECNDPDHGAINAERSESRGLRKAWIELDDKRQQLERELAEARKEIEGLHCALKQSSTIYDVVTEQRDKAWQKIENQAERITYLEGATNHATGTPLSKVIEQRDRLAEAVRLTLMENLDLCDGDVCTLKRLKDAIGFDLENSQADRPQGSV